MTIRVYVGIGSNLDDPIAQVKEAFEELEMLPDTVVEAQSSLYGSKPMGPQDQPDYVNAVASLDTLLSIKELQAGLKRIEDMFGRDRSADKWGPRIIDLDLLMYGKEQIDTPDLVVPHPGMHERDFVIIPLAEIAGNLTIPGIGQLFKLINNCESHSVKKLVTG